MSEPQSARERLLHAIRGSDPDLDQTDLIWFLDQIEADARAPLERLLDRIEQRAALSPLGFDSHADRKTLRLQGVMFAHWIAEQRATPDSTGGPVYDEMDIADINR